MIDEDLDQRILRLIALLDNGHTSLFYLNEAIEELDKYMAEKLAKANFWGELSEVPYTVLDIIIKATKANFVITQSPTRSQSSDIIIVNCFNFSDLITAAHRAATRLKDAPKLKHGKYQRQLQELYIAMQTYIYYA